MKKYFVLAAFALATAAVFTSCKEDPTPEVDYHELQYKEANQKSWNNYMEAVAGLLAHDSEQLYDYWFKSYKGGKSYKEIFTTYAEGSAYATAKDAALQIIDGCIEISNEVGEKKIGDPLKLYKSGKTEDALYAVESWYSHHSREDYANNIASIAKAFYGNMEGKFDHRNANSLLMYIGVQLQKEGKDYHSPTAFTTKIMTDIENAKKAILDIPTPFRNNIGDAKVLKAQEACATLNATLEEAKAYVSAHADEAALKVVVEKYVEKVIEPTYRDLKEKNVELLRKVQALKANPSDAAFKAAAQAWLNARQPWESSEAFLFGPVAEYGLDPNMDSWPLDVVGIGNILKSANYKALEWTGDFIEAPEEGSEEAKKLTEAEKKQADKISAAQNIRGYHTLEYLLFFNGQPRTTK